MRGRRISPWGPALPQVGIGQGEYMSDLRGESTELIGAVARSLGVSVRTLRHWDAEGVVVASGRTDGGYRTYLPGDIARARRVRLMREIGVPLQGIPALLSGDAASRRAELARRRAALEAEITRLQESMDAVDRLVAAEESGVLLSTEEQTDVLGKGWDPAWSSAAREQWGDTHQWAEHAERSSQRNADDWSAVNATVDQATHALAQGKRAGLQPGNPEADALAERHRQAMCGYFHCTPSMHVLIARRFTTEAGFTEHYERLEPGLASWAKEVVEAAARGRGIDLESVAWE